MISLEELREKYNPDGSELRKHQLYMLEMLQYIDDICKKNNINYWLSSGTLLGAIRHKGFIPWDDDCDIEMLRDDYVKLLSVLEKSDDISEKYVLQTHKNDEFYVMPYAKLRKIDTMVYEKGEEDLQYKYRGIFIDIFPLERSCFIVSRITAIIHNKLLVRLANSRLSKGNKRWMLIRMKIFLYNFLYPCIRFFFKPFFSSEVIYHTFGVPFYKKRFISDLFPLRKRMFEKKWFNTPLNYNHYLSIIYGNYMNIPQVDEIERHFSKIEIE